MKKLFYGLVVLVALVCCYTGGYYVAHKSCPFADLIGRCDECHCKVDGKCCCNGVCKPKCDCKKCDCKQEKDCCHQFDQTKEVYKKKQVDCSK